MSLGVCNEQVPAAKAKMCSDLGRNVESEAETTSPRFKSLRVTNSCEEIMYNDATTNNTNSYSGYEVLNIAPNSPISAAQFPIAQYASAVTISGLEMLQNS